MIRASTLGVLLDASSTYAAFTREFDVERHARDGLIALEELNPGITETFLGQIAAYLGTESALPALFSRKSTPLDRLLHPLSAKEEPPVTLLLDCSGSMRGFKIFNIVIALMLVGDALALAGRKFEILGFTTATWLGGEPYEAWREAGRPQNPGRLCPLLHITFKGFEEDWADCRINLLYAFSEGLLKENVDGEALEWAAGRAISQAGEMKPQVVLISDGAPVDQKTLSVNPSDLLESHLIKVIADLEQKVDLRIAYLPSENEPSALHPEATVLDVSELRTREERRKAPAKIARLLAGLLTEPSA